MKIMTYNVHVWYDNEGQFKLQEMVDLCLEVKPDLLCLQEITRNGLNEFVKQTGFTKVFKYHSVAILSNLEIEEMLPPTNTRNFYPRFATVRVPTEGGNEFYLTCVHLDYKFETNRMKELAQIKKHLHSLVKPGSAQVWAGDFNALTLEDYPKETLEEIITVRKVNHWEPPKNDVSLAMKKDGFECSWALVNRPPPISTCRFDTHIDYIYTNKQFRDQFQVVSVEHHASKASDHAPVIAVFQQADQTAADNTAAQDDNTAAQVNNTAAQVNNTAAQVNNTAAQDDNTAAQDDNTAVQDDNTAAQVNNTAAQDGDQ